MSNGAALLLSVIIAAAAAPARSAPAVPPRSPQELLAEMERIQAHKTADHPFERKETDAKLRAFSDAFRAHGLRAVPPLAWYVGAQRRPLKVRLYAAAFLGLIGDPSAYPALRERVFDKTEDVEVRTAALSSIGSLRMRPVEVRPLLDEVAAWDEPPQLRREALAQLAGIGTENVEQAERVAKLHGADPQGLRLGSAVHAVQALGRARKAGAEEALFRLLYYFKNGSSLRGRILTAIARQRLVDRPPSQRALSRDELDTLTGILFEEKGEPPLQAARLLGSTGDARAVPALMRALAAAQDPALLAEAAQSLASIGDPRCAQALLTLERELISDRRFQPRPGQADPRSFALRVAQAAAVFRPAKFAAAPKARPAEKPREKVRPRLVEEDAAARATPFSYEGWPGSGRPKPVWNATAEALRLREEPDSASPALSEAVLKPGEELAFDDSVVITRVPGLVRAEKSFTLEAHEMGPLSRVSRDRHEGPSKSSKLNFREGDQMEVLAYRSDGRCFVRRDDEVYLAPCPQDDRVNFSELKAPDVEWWLHLKTDKHAGWFYAEQEGIDFLPRW